MYATIFLILPQFCPSFPLPFILPYHRGVAYSVKAYQIPLGSRIAKGVPLPQVLPISSEEQVKHHRIILIGRSVFYYTVQLCPV
jgi:hypothetical protein